MYIDKGSDHISRLYYKMFSYEIGWILIMGDFSLLHLTDLRRDSYFLSIKFPQKKSD